MQVSQHFENWDNFVNKCSVCLHAVDGNGTILWANNLELKAMGYEPDEYIGRFIGDFHVDQDVIQDILARLTRDETLNAYPARLRGLPRVMLKLTKRSLQVVRLRSLCGLDKAII